MGKKRIYTPSAYTIKEPERLPFYIQLVQMLVDRRAGKRIFIEKSKLYLSTNGSSTSVGRYEPLIPTPRLLENTIKELKKKGVIMQKKYKWLVDGDITKLAFSESDENFLIAYAILKQKGIIK